MSFFLLRERLTAAFYSLQHQQQLFFITTGGFVPQVKTTLWSRPANSPMRLPRRINFSRTRSLELKMRVWPYGWALASPDLRKSERYGSLRQTPEPVSLMLYVFFAAI